MSHPHKAIAINQHIAASIPKVDSNLTPILYATQEEAQAAADEYAIEMEAKTGISGWNGFIEGVVPVEPTPQFVQASGPIGSPVNS
jgi:hypothetical protein